MMIKQCWLLFYFMRVNCINPLIYLLENLLASFPFRSLYCPNSYKVILELSLANLSKYFFRLHIIHQGSLKPSFRCAMARESQLGLGNSGKTILPLESPISLNERRMAEVELAFPCSTSIHRVFNSWKLKYKFCEWGRRWEGCTLSAPLKSVYDRSLSL